MRTSTATPLTLAALALAAGCGPTFSSDRDETIPIPASATYAFVGGANVGEERDPSLQSTIVHQRIQTAIHEQMAAKGFRRVDNAATADFTVRYVLALKTSVSYSTTSTGVYGGYRGYGWGYGGGSTHTTPIENTEGGLVIDMMKGERQAWRGMVKGDAPDSPPSQERVNSGVSKVMSTLKPGT